MFQDVLNLLKIGRERIRHGWCKGIDRSVNSMGQTCYCMVSAITYPVDENNISENSPVFTSEDIYLARQRLQDCMCELFVTSNVMFKFNDNPTTTQQDVLAVYNYAITRLEQELAR